jgi:hypothetical protein
MDLLVATDRGCPATEHRDLVISSAWRLNWPHQTLATGLRQRFSEDIAPRVIGLHRISSWIWLTYTDNLAYLYQHQ